MIGCRVGTRVGVRVGDNPAPYAFGANWWDPTYGVDASSGVAWTDRVNSVVASEPAGAGAPSWTGVSLGFSAASSQKLTLQGVTALSLLGSKPFVWASVFSGSSFQSGAGAATPRLYLQHATASYLDANNATYAGSSSKQLLVFAHNGTDFIARRNAADIDRVTVALSALTTAALYIGRAANTFANGSFFDVVIADATGWGADFGSRMLSIEKFLIGRM